MAAGCWSGLPAVWWALKELPAHWRSTEKLLTAVLVATHPGCRWVDKGSVEVLEPETSHFISLGLLLGRGSKFRISDLQDSFVLEKYMKLLVFFFFMGILDTI